METSLQKDSQDIAALLSRGYMSLNQFAKIIEVSYPTICRMRDRGEVKVIKVGGINRVYTDEVKRFLNEGNATDEVAGDESSQQPSY